MARRYDWKHALAKADDYTIGLPLWNFPPEARKWVISERKRRWGVIEEEEDIPDPDYH